MDRVLQKLSSISLTSHKECFVSREHSKFSLGKMTTFFLDGHLTDVVLVADNREIPAHKLVLSAGSEIFAAMFRNDFREASQNVIKLPNVDGDVLWALINYCYTGKIELVTHTVEQLLEAASRLLLNKVVEACCKFIQKQLQPSNCIGIKHFADYLGCTGLAEDSQKYTCVSEHFVEVIENEEFLKLPIDEVAALLGSDDVNVSSEENVFKGLLSWIEYDLPHRTEHSFTLLKLIRFPFLSPTFIMDHIEPKSLFANNTDCYKLIMEAYKYHLSPKRHSFFQTLITRPRKDLKVLYVLGRSSDNRAVHSMEKYNAKLNKWTVDDGLQVTTPFDCGLAEVNGRLFIVGGQKGSGSLNTVQCYDMKEKSLRNLPPMITARQNCGVAVLGGSLYAVGGWNPSGVGNTSRGRNAFGNSSRVLNTVEILDLRSERWSSVTPMSTGRTEVGVAVLNGKLYTVGGSDGNNTVIATVECYDPDFGQWVSCASMRIPRKNVGVGVLNGFLYAVGGYHGVLATSDNSVERYDPMTNTWSQVASMKHARWSSSVCALNGKLYAVGGVNGGSHLNSVEAYDPVKDEWEEVAPFIFRRTELLGIVVPSNRLFPCAVSPSGIKRPHESCKGAQEKK